MNGKYNRKIDFHKLDKLAEFTTAYLKDYEADVVKEEARFSDIKTEFADSEGTGILRDEDRARIKRRTGSLDQKWAELNKVHDESKRK